MPPNLLRQFASSISFVISLVSLMLASCVTPSGPREVEMSTRSTYGFVRDMSLVGTIDFQGRTFVADVRGAHYVGELQSVPERDNAFRFRPQTSSGVVLDCSIVRLTRDLWSGQCVDSEKQIIELKVGDTLHV